MPFNYEWFCKFVWYPMVSIQQKNYYGLNCGNSKNRKFRVNARTDGGRDTRTDAQHFSPNLGLKLFTSNIEAWISTKSTNYYHPTENPYWVLITQKKATPISQLHSHMPFQWFSTFAIGSCPSICAWRGADDCASTQDRKPFLRSRGRRQQRWSHPVRERHDVRYLVVLRYLPRNAFFS
jgi:hypothetical protein